MPATATIRTAADATARARRLFSIGPVGGLEGFQRVLILVLPAAGRERRKQRGPQRAHLLPAVPVPDGVLHDAMEQHRQLSGGAVAVLLGQPEHRVLHDVERRLLVAHGEHGLLERASLYAFEKRRKLASRCQGDPLRGYNSRAMLPSWFSRAFSPDRRPWTESRPAPFQAPKSWCAASRRRASSTCSATPAARCCSSTTSCSS